MPFMTVATGECDEAIAGLRADPALAGLLGPDALALVWEISGEPERLLWNSPAAAPLARALADEEGSVYPDSPFHDWLRRSGRAVAPARGVRLERVRLGTDRVASPTMLACRRLALGEGEALLTVVIESAPTRRGRPSAQGRSEQSRVPSPPGEPQPANEPGAATASTLPDAPSVEYLRMLPARRFVWEMDAGGRFTAVSAPLAEVVGAENAAIVGRRWTDIVGRLVLDPTSGVADALAAQTAWSNRPVLWRMADGRHLLPVAMSGTPVRGARHSLEGFRGFGIRRPSEIAVDPDVVATEAGATDIEPEGFPPSRMDSPDPQATTEPVHLETPTEAGREPSSDPHSFESSEATEGGAADGTFVEASPAESAFAHEGSDDLPSPEPAVEPPAPSEAPVQGEGHPAAAAPSYTYPGTPHGLMPMFQVLLDASLSGLSNILAALPASGGRAPSVSDTEPPSRGGPSAPPPDEREVESVEQPQVVQPEAQASVRVEDARQSATSVSAQTHEEMLQGTEAEFGALRARVGGQLGGFRPVPLRLPFNQDDVGRDDAEPEMGEARPVLSFSDRGALHEIARALGARIEGLGEGDSIERRGPADIVQIAQQPRARDLARLPDQMPLGLLVHRGEALLYANRFLLDLAGSDETGAAASAEDASTLFARGLDPSLQPGQPPATALIMGQEGGRLVECRAAAVEWGDTTASLQLVTLLEDADPALRMRALELDIAQRDRRLDEIAAVLALATDGIVILDTAGKILSLNPGAERLFGYDQTEVAGEPITNLLAPESHAVALAAIDALTNEGTGSGTEAGEVTGRSRAGQLIPLSIVLGNINTAEPSLCLVIRDISHRRELEGALATARRKAEDTDKQRTEFLAWLSQELRTSLNAIIGFAELMVEERLGTAGEHHQSYLGDILDSGRQAVGLVDELLDPARTNSGEVAASSKGADLNQAVAQGVSEVQPVAARGRIVVRTSFAPELAPVLSDEASLRQIVTNVLSHAIGRTDAGGQVIASTAMADNGGIVFRVRDTGRPMSAEEIEAALQPIRPLRRAHGTGLAPAKAMAEAKRGNFAVTSRPHEGTLVEVVLPASRNLR